MMLKQQQENGDLEKQKPHNNYSCYHLFSTPEQW